MVILCCSVVGSLMLRKKEVKRERERKSERHRSCQHKKVLGWLESAHHKNEKQV